MHLRRLLFAIWLMVLPGGCVHATTYVVSQRNPGASDDGPGNSAAPWKTLAHAVRCAGPGDRVLIQDGIYREHVIMTTNGTAQQPIRFEAAPGAEVVLTGADRLANWHSVAGNNPVYRIAWPYRFIGWSKYMAHPDDDYHQLIGRCEQVVVDGYLLHQVLEAGQMSPGSFFVDVSNQLLYAWDSAGRDLNQLFVEASARAEILRVEGNYVEVRGLHFRFAANMAQHGAVVLAGRHDLLEDCDIAEMNSCGASLTGEDLVVRRCVFRDNGQLGFGAAGAHRLLFTDCLVENNNTKGFNRGWEAGGDKLVLCRDATLERSRFLRNRGSGIWFDIGNEQCTVRQCLIADNEDGGLFDEISYGLHAHDNVIVGNGFASTSGSWGAQAGITLSSSPDSVIERNIIMGNREGFDFREQTRTTPRIGQAGEVPVWNHDELIRNNIITRNREAQVWGWFDVPDNRYWPVKGINASTSQDTVQTRKPTLEDLKLRFRDNIYYPGSGPAFFEWGPPWRRHKSYSNLSDFQKDLGLDVGGRVMDPKFSNPFANDYRVSSEIMNDLKPCYPEGNIPGCDLGVN